MERPEQPGPQNHSSLTLLAAPNWSYCPSLEGQGKKTKGNSSDKGRELTQQLPSQEKQMEHKDDEVTTYC